MLTVDRTRTVLGGIGYFSGWLMRVVLVGDSHAIQVRSPLSPVWGRLWLIMEHHDESDIVRTVFQAIGAVEEHERREHFTFNGALVWDPHQPVFLTEGIPA